MLSDLVLEGQVINAFDQVVDGVDVGVDRLEPVDLCPDGCRVGQNELRTCRAALSSLTRNSSRTELTGSWAGRRSRSELGRDGLGHRDGHGYRDRTGGGHGWLRLRRDTGYWDAGLVIHFFFIFFWRGGGGFLLLCERLCSLFLRLEVSTGAAGRARAAPGIWKSSRANNRSPRKWMVCWAIGATKHQ